MPSAKFGEGLLIAYLTLHRLRRIPQDCRVHTFGINRKQPVIGFERRLGLGSNPVEIANVFSCRLYVIWRIGRTWPFVSRNNRYRLERFNRIECRDPFLAAFSVGFA